MPLVPVPELRRKLALLRAYSPRTSWALLAAPFGVSPKTVKYWGHGSATRAVDQIPAEALPVLLDLFAELLPRAGMADDVRRLVLGPIAQLEAEIRSGAASSFAALIEREGQKGTAVLVRKREESLLVEMDDEEGAAGVMRLKLGALFRVEFPMRVSCLYAAALQGVQHAWAVVPSIVSDKAPRRVFMPSLDENRTPRFMRERRDTGLHRFVCLQAAEPFPVAIEEHRRENALLHKRVLDEVAAFYTGLAASRRACHLLKVAIEPDVTT